MTRSTVEVATLATAHGAFCCYIDLQNRPAADTMVVFEGSARDWRALSSSSVDWESIDLVCSRPSILVAVLQGPLRGGPAQFCNMVDMVFCVESDSCGPSHYEDHEIIHVPDPKFLAEHLEMLERCIVSIGSPAVVTATLMRTQRDWTTRDALFLESLAYSLLQSGVEYAEWLQAKGSLS